MAESDVEMAIRKTISSHNFKRGRAGGFTLVEMVIVLAMIGILVAIAFPSFREWQRNAQVNSAAREMYGYFQRARGEAVRNNAPVAIQFTSGVGAAGRAEMFVDDGRGGGNAANRIRDGAEPLVGPTMTMPRRVELVDFSFDDLAFGPSFMPNGTATPGDLCITNGTRSYEIRLFAAGSVQMTRVPSCL